MYSHTHSHKHTLVRPRVPLDVKKIRENKINTKKSYKLDVLMCFSSQHCALRTLRKSALVQETTGLFFKAQWLLLLLWWWLRVPLEMYLNLLRFFVCAARYRQESSWNKCATLMCVCNSFSLSLCCLYIFIFLN